MEALMLVFPLISFDFLKKTKESACQALLPNRRGFPYVGGGTGETGNWDICNIIYMYICAGGGRRRPPPRARGLNIPLEARITKFPTECLVSLRSGLGKPSGVAFSLSGPPNSTPWCTSGGCGVSHAAMHSLSESLVFTRIC